MKTGRVFWGVLLIVLGGLFLLDNLGALNFDFGGVWRFWPLIFVFWGISALIKEPTVKWAAAALVAVLIGVIVYWFFSFRWFGPFEGDTCFAEGTYEETVLAEPYKAGVERASLEVSSGMARIVFEGATDQLIEAETKTSFGRYELEASYDDGSASLELSFNGNKGRWPFRRIRNEAIVRLNKTPVWDVRFELGAAKADIDLSSHKVEDVSIDAGATSVTLRMGNLVDVARVKIETGVSTFVVEIPSDVGCSVRSHAPLSSKKFSDLRRVGSGRYESEGFDEAAKKIFLEFDAGVSKLRVNRY